MSDLTLFARIAAIIFAAICLVAAPLVIQAVRAGMGRPQDRPRIPR